MLTGQGDNSEEILKGKVAVSRTSGTACGCGLREGNLYSHWGGKIGSCPSKSTLFRANSFQAPVFFWEGIGFQHSPPQMDLKSDGSFVIWWQTGFLRRFQDAGPPENPGDFSVQTSASKALPSLLSLCPLPWPFCLPSRDQACPLEVCRVLQGLEW